MANPSKAEMTRIRKWHVENKTVGYRAEMSDVDAAELFVKAAQEVAREVRAHFESEAAREAEQNALTLGKRINPRRTE